MSLSCNQKVTNLLENDFFCWISADYVVLIINEFYFVVFVIEHNNELKM